MDQRRCSFQREFCKLCGRARACPVARSIRFSRLRSAAIGACVPKDGLDEFEGFLIVLRNELGSIYTSVKLTSDEVGSLKSRKISEWLSCYEKNKNQLGRGNMMVWFMNLSITLLMSWPLTLIGSPVFARFLRTRKVIGSAFFEEVEALSEIWPKQKGKIFCVR